MVAVKSRPVALSAAPVVKWLIRTEPDVRAAVRRFAANMADTNVITVAGPPIASELLKARKNAAYQPELPMVTLKCAMVKHHLTGEEGVEVTCSDLDADKLVRWHNEGKLRAAMPRGVGHK